MSILQIALIIIGLILFCIWFALVMDASWNSWEDKYYEHKLRKKPDKYDYCVAGDCKRPRPHKKMTWVKYGTYGNDYSGYVCDEHLKEEG